MHEIITAENLSLTAKIATVLITGFGVCIARQGLNTWRDQFLFKERFKALVEVDEQLDRYMQAMHEYFVASAERFALEVYPFEAQRLASDIEKDEIDKLHVYFDERSKLSVAFRKYNNLNYSSHKSAISIESVETIKSKAGSDLNERYRIAQKAKEKKVNEENDKNKMNWLHACEDMKNPKHFFDACSEIREQLNKERDRLLKI